MLDCEARALLASEGWLSRCPDSFRQVMLDLAVVARFQSGQSLIVAGDPPGGLFGIASGTFELTPSAAMPDLMPIYHGGAGDWLGEGSVITGSERRATVTAMVPVVALHVELARLREQLAARPDWWRWIALLSSLVVDKATMIGADLAIRSGSARCIAVMLRTAGCRHVGPAPGVDVTAPVTHVSLAGMANVSRAYVSRLLAELGHAGLVRTGYRGIRLLDVPSLRRRLDSDI